MQTMAGEGRQMEERFDRVNERLDETNRRIREGREETNQRFRGVDRRITEMKAEMNWRFDRVEGDIVELKQGVATVQAMLNRFSASLAIAVIAVIVTIFARG